MAVFSALFGFAAFAFVVRGDINCASSNACQNGDYTCLGDGCEIDCGGQDACQDSEFTCQESCSVDCTQQDSCIAAQFHFYGGNVGLACSSQNSCENAIVSCNNNTVLDVSCDGEDACEALQVVMYQNSTFSISCDGDDSCTGATCYCFSDDGCESSGDLECTTSITEFKRRNGQHALNHMKRKSKQKRRKASLHVDEKKQIKKARPVKSNPMKKKMLGDRLRRH